MSGAPNLDQLLFDLVWPGWRAAPPADGLVVFVPGQRTATAWADMVLAHEQDGFVVWAATGAQPHPSIALMSGRTGVQAASLAPAGEDPRRVHVALRLARRLATDAVFHGEPDRVYLTSPGMPDTWGDLVRVPHLVTIRGERGALVDTVVWELMASHYAVRRLGVALPDPALVEAHLPDLLALRTATRTRQLPAGLSRPLAALLTGRPSPLSIELVYRHLYVFLDQFAGRLGGAA